MMRKIVMRRVSRLILLFLHVLLGAALTLAFARQREGELPTARFRAITGWWHRRLCRILKIKITVKGTPFAGDALFVANHISWLDIPILGALAEMDFLSKDEVRRWPLVGWLAARSGTLFIQRGGKNASNAAAEAMTFRLRGRHSVLIFPEGTTTEGDGVRRFHPRLFGAAVLAQAPVQPIAIRYPHVEKIHPTAPFVGDDELPSHLWQILGEREIEAEVRFLNPVSSKDAERKELAEQTRARILQVIERHPRQSNGLGDA